MSIVMKKIFTLMAAAALAFAAQAAELTVADGTDTNEYIPFCASYFNYPPYFGQVIYPASQLTQLEGKDITALKFYIANENGNVMNGGELSFFLGVVDVSEYSTISPFRIPESSLTLVGKLPMTPGEAEIVVNFDAPFAYEGGNLAVMVSVTQAGTISGTGSFYGVRTGVPSAVYGGNQFFTESFYPKTTFTYEQYVEPEFIRGDVNGDKDVTISDVTALIDLLLGGGTIDNPAADCNQSGDVTISDVTALIDFLLGGAWN